MGMMLGGGVGRELATWIHKGSADLDMCRHFILFFRGFRVFRVFFRLFPVREILKFAQPIYYFNFSQVFDGSFSVQRHVCEQR